VSTSFAVPPQTRLRSSFIYLANAVNDLIVNWRTLALVLAPIALLGTLCLLPDMVNLQHQLAEKFAPGVHNVGWRLTQEPYLPSASDTKPLFPSWALVLFHSLSLVLGLGVNLLTMCVLRRDRAGNKLSGLVDEAIAIYREAGTQALSFYWLVLLQWVVPLIAVGLLRLDIAVSEAWMLAVLYILEVTMAVLAALIYLWLYFARYALIFDGRRSFHGLLFSRDLIRKRFFRVATRIVVFLAVAWGYNSWAAGFFIFVSVVLGPVGALTGYLWSIIFVLDLATVAVTYSTIAFFTAAAVRLYQDVTSIAGLAVEPFVTPNGGQSEPAPVEALTAT
jgi:hypothetical protein